MSDGLNKGTSGKSFRMGLALRTLIVVSVTLVATMGLLMLYSQTIVKRGFETVENRDAMININRLQEAFAMQVENVDVKIIDWSLWDDAYNYMQDGNAAFEKSSLEVSSLLGMKFELFVFRLPDGKIRWGREFDLHQETDLPLDPAIVEFFNKNPELFQFKNEEDRKTGIVNLPKLGPTFMAVQPVLTSEGKGPIVGSLVAGRAINADMMDRLMKLTHLDLVLKTPEVAKADPEFGKYLPALKSPDDMVIRPLDEKTISGFTMFNDVFGHPIAYVQMKTPREIYAQGKSTINSFYAALTMAGIAFGLGVLFMLQRSVVSRVTKLASALTHIRGSSNLNLRAPVAGNDEITDLASTTNEMLASIEDGQRAISARNDDMKLILDNAEQGFLNVSEGGEIIGERSTVVDRWFGEPAPGVKIWDHLNKNNPKRAKLFRLGWDQLVQGFLPFEIMAAQIQKRLTLGDDTFELALRPVNRDKKLTSVLVVLSNVTEAVKAEARGREQKEMMRVFQNILVDKNAVVEFFEETRKGVAEVSRNRTKMSHEVLLRAVHTFKGNGAQQGLDTFAQVCHELEAVLLEGAGAEIAPEKWSLLEQTWKNTEERFKALLEDAKAVRVEVDRYEFNNTVTMVQNGLPHDVIYKTLMSWELDPVLSRLTRLGRVAEGLGKRLEKDLKVTINDSGIKIEKECLKDFWAGMVHVIRNAIDHGIETPDERDAKGKTPMGTINLSARIEDDSHLVITVKDDGKGIDWKAVQTQARKRNIPAETKEDLINALFADGVSTKDEVTDISGRGVGMAAVKQVVEKLGGKIRIETNRDEGTTFDFVFPRSAVNYVVVSYTAPMKRAS
jgi:sensor domain CHASE-containing protein/HPt (histidine-containing phosphotransfer) domain-containing protein